MIDVLVRALLVGVAIDPVFPAQVHPMWVAAVIGVCFVTGALAGACGHAVRAIAGTIS